MASRAWFLSLLLVVGSCNSSEGDGLLSPIDNSGGGTSDGVGGSGGSGNPIGGGQTGIDLLNGLSLNAFAGDFADSYQDIGTGGLYRTLKDVPLTAQGLASHPGLNALVQEAVAEYAKPEGEFSETSDGALFGELLDYLYSCTMAEGAELVLSDQLTLRGFVGLAPGWGAADGSCNDIDCQEWVSACLMARVSKKVQPILLLGSHETVPNEVPIEQQDRFSLRESSFYGNTFEADRNRYACAGPGSTLQSLTQRFCGVFGADGFCPIEVVADCTIQVEGLSNEELCNPNGCPVRLACDNDTAVPTKCYTEQYRCDEEMPATSFNRILTLALPDPRAEEVTSPGEWARRDGGACHEEVTGPAISPTGETVLAGLFRVRTVLGNRTFDASGVSDSLLYKLDTNGDIIWSRHFDTEGFEPDNVAVDSVGDIYLAGNYTGHVDFGAGRTTATNRLSTALVKFDSSGEVLWERHFHSRSLFLSGRLTARVAVRGTAVVLAAGYRRDVSGPGVSEAAGNDDPELLVAKLSASGTVQWSTSLGGNGDQRLRALDIDLNGGVIVAGYFESQAKFGTQQFSTTGSSGFGSFSSQEDGYIVRLDSSEGDISWAVQVGSPNARDRVNGVSVGATGAIAFVGEHGAEVTLSGINVSANNDDPRRLTDGLVGVLESSNGNARWLRSWGDSFNDFGQSVVWDTERVIAFGAFRKHTPVNDSCLSTPRPEGLPDDILSELEQPPNMCWLSSQTTHSDLLLRSHAGVNGELLNARKLGGFVLETPVGISVPAPGKVSLTGEFTGAIDFGPAFVNNATGSNTLFQLVDTFVAQIGF